VKLIASHAIFVIRFSAQSVWAFISMKRMLQESQRAYPRQ
jgi:hypothetical protein